VFAIAVKMWYNIKAVRMLTVKHDVPLATNKRLCVVNEHWKIRSVKI